jgi:hypothetical protein
MTTGCMCKDPTDCQSVMAEVRWDFVPEQRVRVTGHDLFDCAVKAERQAKSMNEIYGEDTHVLTLKNVTSKEFYKNRNGN